MNPLSPILKNFATDILIFIICYFVHLESSMFPISESGPDRSTACRKSRRTQCFLSSCLRSSANLKFIRLYILLKLLLLLLLLLLYYYIIIIIIVIILLKHGIIIAYLFIPNASHFLAEIF